MYVMFDVFSRTAEFGLTQYVVCKIITKLLSVWGSVRVKVYLPD